MTARSILTRTIVGTLLVSAGYGAATLHQHATGQPDPSQPAAFQTVSLPTLVEVPITRTVTKEVPVPGPERIVYRDRIRTVKVKTPAPKPQPAPTWHGFLAGEVVVCTTPGDVIETDVTPDGLMWAHCDGPHLH